MDDYFPAHMIWKAYTTHSPNPNVFDYIVSINLESTCQEDLPYDLIHIIIWSNDHVIKG